VRSHSFSCRVFSGVKGPGGAVWKGTKRCIYAGRFNVVQVRNKSARLRLVHTYVLGVLVVEAVTICLDKNDHLTKTGSGQTYSGTNHL
jgi:hypothetical protein